MYDLNTIKKQNKPKSDLKPELMESITHTITIGRNIGADPMPNHKWQGFKSAIESFIDSHESEIFVKSEGYGIWDGIKESNFTFVFTTKKHLDIDHLKRLSKLFKQDAIALTSGTTRLIGDN